METRNNSWSFAKIFWIGFLLTGIIRIILKITLANNLIIQSLIILIMSIIWSKYLISTRYSIQSSFWYYVGVTFALLPVILFGIGFLIGLLGGLVGKLATT